MIPGLGKSGTSRIAFSQAGGKIIRHPRSPFAPSQEWSGREDSNLRPPSPEPGALPTALRPDRFEITCETLTPGPVRLTSLPLRRGHRAPGPARARPAAGAPIRPPAPPSLAPDQWHEGAEAGLLLPTALPARRSMIRSTCLPPDPIGTTRRPPTASCSSRLSGTRGAPAVTTIPSYGANWLHPTDPSPIRWITLLNPESPRGSAAPVGPGRESSRP